MTSGRERRAAGAPEAEADSGHAAARGEKERAAGRERGGRGQVAGWKPRTTPTSRNSTS
jgi:hypothetical protein